MRRITLAGLVSLCSAAPLVAQTLDRHTPQWIRGLDAAAFTESFAGSDADASAGVAARLRIKVVRVAADGSVAWSVAACATCAASDPDAGAWAVDLLPDGSAWLLVTRPPVPPATTAQQVVVRVGADGSTLGETPIPSLVPLYYADQTVLIGDANQVVAFTRAGRAAGLRRTRVANGAVAESQVIAFGGQHDDAAIVASRRWDDGSLSLALVEQNTAGCIVDPPVCPTPRTTLLRLEANGTERWRTDLGESRPAPFVAFEDDGTGVALTAEREAALKLRTVASDGTAAAPITLPEIVDARATRGAGPVNGRYLVATRDVLRLIDRNGVVAASRATPVPGYGLPLASSTRGFVVTYEPFEALLISATDLADVAELTINGSEINLGGRPAELAFWRLLDDGTIYTSAPYTKRNDHVEHLSRFAVPGSPAFDFVFRDDFD